MPKLTRQLTVAAPADAVWAVIGPDFDRIGEWATAIPASTAIARPAQGDTHDEEPATGLVDAPVAGRVCATGIRIAPKVTETLIAYDHVRRSFTYEASGMPSFVTTARNTWTVTPIDSTRCLVTLDAQFETRGVLGALAGWLLLAQVGRTSRHLADDLRHFVQHGTPSPRKRRQLRANSQRQPS